jgi:hypothetical protein
VFPFFRRSQPVPAPVQAIAPAPALEVRADGDPNWWDILTGIAGPASLSGPEVSPLSTLNVAAVRAAVDLISGIMGTLPVAIYQTADGGGQEVADDHPGQLKVARRTFSAPTIERAFTRRSSCVRPGSGRGPVARRFRDAFPG